MEKAIPWIAVIIQSIAKYVRTLLFFVVVWLNTDQMS